MKSKKLAFGVGVNDADYPVHIRALIDGKSKNIWRCPFYQAWSNMIKRAYSAQFHDYRPTYAGCSVDPAWHSFMEFRAWMIAQDWEGKQLDKDILMPGNKVYSPETCAFVTRALNLFTTDHGVARGEWPVGVCWHKRDENFRAKCCNPLTGQQECLGYFTCPNQAHQAWRKRKHDLACQLADIQTDARVAEALRNRYKSEEQAI